MLLRHNLNCKISAFYKIFTIQPTHTQNFKPIFNKNYAEKLLI